MFIQSTGIATDETGNVYVVDTGNNRVVEFTETGTYIIQWGPWVNDKSVNDTFNKPTGITTVKTLDGRIHVYVVDTGNNRVVEFDSTAAIATTNPTVKYLNQWGTPGSGNGQFYYPEGIATFKTTLETIEVYVVDRGNNRVQKFTSDGAYLTQWGSLGIGNGQFRQPTGTATDSIGNVYVVDSNNNRMQKFTLAAPPPIPATPTPTPTPALLKADFTANPTMGDLPLNVSFKDQSSGSPMTWLWAFGDGSTSTLQNPVHTYLKSGAYSVKLKVSNPSGTNALSRSYYIIVSTASIITSNAVASIPTIVPLASNQSK